MNALAPHATASGRRQTAVSNAQCTPVDHNNKETQSKTHLRQAIGALRLTPGLAPAAGVEVDVGETWAVGDVDAAEEAAVEPKVAPSCEPLRSMMAAGRGRQTRGRVGASTGREARRVSAVVSSGRGVEKMRDGTSAVAVGQRTGGAGIVWRAGWQALGTLGEYLGRFVCSQEGYRLFSQSFFCPPQQNKNLIADGHDMQTIPVSRFIFS